MEGILSPTNPPSISVHWAQPAIEPKADRLFRRILGLICLVFNGIVFIALASSYGIGECCLVALLFCLAGYVLMRTTRRRQPKPRIIQFHAERTNGGLRLQEIRPCSETENLCNYFNENGIYPAIDHHACPADTQILLMGLTMERFARLLEGARIEPSERRQAA